MNLKRSHSRGLRALALAFVLSFSAVSSFAQTCKEIFGVSRSSVAFKYFAAYEARSAAEIEETIGIEVEAAVPFSVGARGVAEAIAHELQKSGLTVQKSFHYETLAWKNKAEVYQIRYTIGDVPYLYAIKQDYSVMAGAGYLPLEIVSPILRSEQDHATHDRLMESVVALGVRAEPNTAGVHIHVGMKDVTVGELGLLGYVFHLLEKDLMKRFKVAQSRLPFIRPMDPVLQEIFANNGILGTTVRNFLDVNFQGPLARRHALNMLSLLKFATVEFRLFNSTLDSVVLDFERRLVAGLIRAIRTKNPAFVDWVMQLEKGQAGFEELLDVLGISRSEWADVQNRVEAEARSLVEGKGRLFIRKIISAPASLYKGYVEPYLLMRRRDGWTPR